MKRLGEIALRVLTHSWCRRKENSGQQGNAYASAPITPNRILFSAINPSAQRFNVTGNSPALVEPVSLSGERK